MASEVGLGTGAGAGARSGTGLGAKPAEDGDSEVPVAAGRESEGATIVAKRRQGKRATKHWLEQKRLRKNRYMGKPTAEAGAGPEQQRHGSPGPGQEPR